jgi:acyl-CoA synthetase (AMP-forming)/AMP-acid ligase II
MQTLGELLLRNEEYFPDQTAIIYEDRKYTYQQLVKRSRKLANALYQRGARRQHRISILAMNCSEYVEVYSACYLAGYIAGTVNFRLAAPEYHYILNDSQPTVLIFEEQYSDVIASLRDDLKSIRHFICIGKSPDWAEEYEQVLSSGADESPVISPFNLHQWHNRETERRNA